MCSIAGILKAQSAASTATPLGKTDELHSMVAQMLASQRHRAPDGSGIFEDRDIVLGHGRLAILDLSLAGRQPMTSRDGRWTIVFNGEIFNYQELKQGLEGCFRGPFRSATDTEVLLEACAAWGVERTLQRSAGMFAFGLWDHREREVTLVRDRLGEKPLVYYWDRCQFAFASELKALAGFHDRRLNPLAVDAYLALGYVPAPLAIFAGCRKLPAGHLLRYRPGGEPRVEKWWHPENSLAEIVPGAGGGEGGGKERTGQLRQRLKQAVGERLRADVPVALALSAGVDSSVIAAECAAQEIRPHTFTVRFGSAGKAKAIQDSVARTSTSDESGDASEVPRARALAAKLGLTHEVLEVGECFPPAHGLNQIVRNIVRHYDEPFADSSALGCLALASALQGRYKVILNGDGGDEVFAGYPHYEHIGIKQFVKRAAASAGVVDGRRADRTYGDRVHSDRVYVESKVLFRSKERAQLMALATGDPVQAAKSEPAFLAAFRSVAHCPLPSASTLQRALWMDRSLPLANGLNYKTDIALGAYGIEGRAPFLDHRVVEWAQQLPDRDLVAARGKKVLLRQAYANDLPPEVLHAPKRGFGAPVARWLEGPLAGQVRDELPCPLLQSPAQHGLTGQKLWALLVFAGWAREWKARW